jgi:uncharacterized protein (UPF0335 family)
MEDDGDVIDLAERSKTGRKKKPGKLLKETLADKAVRACVLENAGKRLLEIVNGVEDLDERIGTLREDRRTRLANAKGEGYSVAAIKAVIKRRAASPEAIAAAEELDEVTSLYIVAIGDAQGS